MIRASLVFLLHAAGSILFRMGTNEPSYMLDNVVQYRRVTLFTIIKVAAAIS